MCDKVRKAFAPEFLAYGVRFGRNLRLNGDRGIQPSQECAGIVNSGRIPSKLDYRFPAQFIRNEYCAVGSDADIVLAGVLLTLADVAR